MKTDHIPDIYLEQYVLGELPDNLRREIDNLAMHDPAINNRINEILESNSDILAAYPPAFITGKILAKNKSLAPGQDIIFTGNRGTRKKSGFIQGLKNLMRNSWSTPLRRYSLSLSSAAVFILIAVFLFPGIRNTFMAGTGSDEGIRIKGLESKLILYKMKGKNIEELKNNDTARRGDIIQVGYVATGVYRYGVILSIDGRGAVTLHYPAGNSPGTELSLNKKTLLSRSYELDDSPYFERFILILSREPIDTGMLIEKTKKLAISRDTSLTGSVKPAEDDTEISIIIKKTE